MKMKMKMKSVLLGVFALTSFSSLADTVDVGYCADASNTTIKHVKYQYQSAPASGTRLLMFVSLNKTPTARAACNTNTSYPFYLDMTDEYQASLAKSIETAHANGDSVHMRGRCTCIGFAGHAINAENVAMFKIN